MTSDSASRTGWCEPHEQVRAARADEGMTNKISSPQSHTLLFGDFSQGEGECRDGKGEEKLEN